MIWDATLDDVDAIAGLGQRVREQYAIYQPTFWRVATNALDLHRAFVAHLVADGEVLSLVATDDEHRLLGYAFATVAPAPPVYDPGGLTAMVDDFAVADDDLWSTVGVELGAALRRRVADRGAVQMVVVCGAGHEAKRAALQAMGLTVASEWWVGPAAVTG
jgi:hypothetical protein